MKINKMLRSTTTSSLYRLSLRTAYPQIRPCNHILSISSCAQFLPLQRRHAHSASPPLAAKIVGALPPKLKPYAYLARLDKPVGSWLLYWPCGTSLVYLLNGSMEYYPRCSTWTYPADSTDLDAHFIRHWCSRNARRRLYHKRPLG